MEYENRILCLEPEAPPFISRNLRQSMLATKRYKSEEEGGIQYAIYSDGL